MRPRGANKPLSACRECIATQQVGRPGSCAAASSSPVPTSGARFHDIVSVVCWCMNCRAVLLLLSMPVWSFAKLGPHRRSVAPH